MLLNARVMLAELDPHNRYRLLAHAMRLLSCTPSSTDGGPAKRRCTAAVLTRVILLRDRRQSLGSASMRLTDATSRTLGGWRLVLTAHNKRYKDGIHQPEHALADPLCAAAPLGRAQCRLNL